MRNEIARMNMKELSSFVQKKREDKLTQRLINAGCKDINPLTPISSLKAKQEAV